MPHPTDLYRMILVLLYATGVPQDYEAARIKVEDIDLQASAW